MPTSIMPPGFLGSPPDPNAPLYGEDLSLSSAKRRRKMAEALIAQGTEGGPVGHWMGAVARALQGVVGGYQARKADDEEKAINSRLAKALQGGDIDAMSREALATGAIEPADLIKSKLAAEGSDTWGKTLISVVDPVTKKRKMVMISGRGEIKDSGLEPPNPFQWIKTAKGWTPVQRFPDGSGQDLNTGAAIHPEVMDTAVDAPPGSVPGGAPAPVQGGGAPPLPSGASAPAAGTASPQDVDTQGYGSMAQGGAPPPQGAPAPAVVPGQPIPGTDQYTETQQTEQAKGDVGREMDQPQAFGRLRSMEASYNRINDQAKAIRDDPNLPLATGTVAEGLQTGDLSTAKGYLPWNWQEVKNIDARRKSLVAQIGFSTLADMREMSKNGGALGQIAIQELERLENAIVALDSAQDTKTYQAALTNLIEINDAAKKRLNDVYGQTYGGVQQRGGMQPPPGGGGGAITVDQDRALAMDTIRRAKNDPAIVDKISKGFYKKWGAPLGVQ